MDKPLVTTFLAEIENLAKEYNFEIEKFAFDTKKHDKEQSFLKIKFKATRKGQ